jgi:hypothetical protein
MELSISSRKLLSSLGRALHVVARRERDSLGMFFVVGGVVHVRAVCPPLMAEGPVGRLSALIGDLQSAGVLPAGLRLGGSRAAVWRSPAGEALDLETHAAKRCLLLGTAGGFADTLSGQTLWPSARSAAVAADAALAALASPDPQESLMQFKSGWRRLLADDLRPPSSSVHLLLPLLLSNKNLLERFTRALLYGRSV